MLREEYLRRLINACPIQVFLAGNDGGRIYWPYRMARENGSLGHRHRDACEVYWVDSSFKNEDYGNREALDDAEKYNAEAVLLADVYQDFEATVSAVRDGVETAKSHSFDGDVIIPLQAPYAECYERLSAHDIYAIGGLKDASDAEQIQATRAVRDVAGDDVHLHGLGWGPTGALADTIRSEPGLLDSVDYSTPIQSNTRKGGDEIMSVTAAYAGAELIEVMQRLTRDSGLQQTFGQYEQ